MDDEKPALASNGLPSRRSGKLYATGDVGLYGVDARPDLVHPEGTTVFVIMRGAELRYLPQIKAVIVKSPEVFVALAADV